MTAHVEFGYWSDPLCIWAFVAQEKLERVLAEFGEHLTVDYRVIPVFGSVPSRFASGPWRADGVAGRVAATRRIAAEHGHPEVSGRCWERDCPASSWSAGAAIRAVFAVERAGLAEPGSGPLFQLRLRERFFVQEQNVSRRSVQLDLLEELRIARAPVEELLDDGRALALVWDDFSEKERLKLQGSPTFVFDGGRAMLYGNFSFGVLKSTVEELIRGAGAGGSACS
ncbi:MAG: hypothetical protein AMXMBFR56_20750 [Polyangiaceae bacterium]